MTSAQGARFLPVSTPSRTVGTTIPLFRHGCPLLLQRGCEGCDPTDCPRGVEDPEVGRRNHLQNGEWVRSDIDADGQRIRRVRCGC